jgi:RHS repeat-associated protein
VHTDHLNTPRRVTQPSGNQLRWTWEADPFGAATPNENPASLGTFKYNLRFPGQIYDSHGGLMQNYFRDYDPTTGRYVESDPIGLDGGLNPYIYAEADPLGFSDPTGECPWCVAAAIGALTDLSVQLYFNGFDLKCVNWWEVAGSGAAAGLGVGMAAKLTKLGKLGTYSTKYKYGGPKRPTYRFFESKGNVRIESHPISREAPDWYSYPHWHPDLLGKPWSKVHLPLVEPAIGLPAAAINAKRDDCACKK